jgi:peptidoglycan/LPS O-acetylase OafA/YrhL
MKVYFKNLDGIRFIAALLVVLHHAQFFKVEHQVNTLSFLNRALNTGRTGVNLFFVLSGFLISYLLLQENAKTGTISFKNFYIRRILRIWPLYMAYGISLTVLAPFIFKWMGVAVPTDLGTILVNLVFLLLFAVNFQLAFFPYNKGILEITWSVCVEEQFYLIWPVLILFFRKRLKTLFITMLSIGLFGKILCITLPLLFDVTRKRMLDIAYLMLFDKLELFGAGMFAAYIWFNRDAYRNFLRRWFSLPVQAGMLIFTLLVVFNVLKIDVVTETYFDNFIHAACFAYLMIAAVSEKSILRLEHPLLKNLGKVSYGIYLFHPPVCNLVMLGFVKVFGSPGSVWVYDILYPAACVGLTSLIAHFSYELFEKHFLKIKTKFAVIQTRV